MLNKIFPVIAVGLLSLSTACAGDTSQVNNFKIVPEKQHSAVYSTSMQLIASYHYQKPQLADKFSADAFDSYLKNMDASKVYFYDSDIASFQKYKYQIDESIFSGDLTFAYEVFNIYQSRLMERINYALTLLNDSTNFNFSLADSIEIDREKSSYVKTEQEMNALWALRLKYECLSQKAAGKSFKEISETIKKRYENLKKISQKTKSEDVFQLYMNSLTEITDPHTNYYSPRASQDFATSMSLSLEGIGATLQTENEYTKVREVVKGGPADKSKKIHAGDRITAVAQGDSDFVNVIDWRIDDVVSLIRGKKGTIVRLEIIPADDPTAKRIVEIKRDKIVLEDQSAKSSIKEVSRKGKTYKYGVVSIPAFYIDFAAARKGDANYKSTTRDVKKLITELKKQKIDGLIIDLRNNGGGSLQEAVELTGLFIKSGPVVQVRDATGNTGSEIDKNPELFYDGDLVVLVNRFSASASEIFAAAMQDYGRGVVIGEKTFGKGTVQNMVGLNEFIKIDDKQLGEVKLTIAKFYRVTGSSTQHKGVIPDIEFPGVYDGDEFGEDASPYALPWDQIASVPFERVNLYTERVEKFKRLHSQRMTASKEYQYLLEDIQQFKVLNEKKYQTLNVDGYKKELEDAESAKKKRADERKLRNASNPDLILDEALEILVDIQTIK